MENTAAYTPNDMILAIAAKPHDLFNQRMVSHAN